MADEQRRHQGLSPRVRGNQALASRVAAASGSIPACAGEPSIRRGSCARPRVYPRVCGGTTPPRIWSSSTRGLSPRVRGNLIIGAALGACAGSIPACAGEPCPAAAGSRIGRVYPRVCGGTSESACAPLCGAGLSPRVRGNRRLNACFAAVAGSIPACAGEPRLPSRPRHTRRVYPRVCGGTGLGQWIVVCRQGLSPRVRGNRRPSSPACACSGSIPACAGEPTQCRSPRPRWRVYPRVCGGTDAALAATLMVYGLSPRVRGNLPVGEGGLGVGGSIPACAGEPAPPVHRRKGGWVYPRVCGGTIRRGVKRRNTLGLSPRVRGNHDDVVLSACLVGSIPACAGEPPASRDGAGGGEVYPRVCGGTGQPLDARLDVAGLSPRVRGNPSVELRAANRHGSIPRVRGNHQQHRPIGARSGSIPACAGEPALAAHGEFAAGVYPRVCGGTPAGMLDALDLRGLSPRVRGNPQARVRRGGAAGSIPACAGEPRRRRGQHQGDGVYPRVCGGTTAMFFGNWADVGLSPRVRGNRPQRGVPFVPDGSIPACAGEPIPASPRRRCARVYPRVCGGTQPCTSPQERKAGLSPRVRGNRRGDAVAFAVPGSIPACAGEPRPDSGGTSRSRVYPRVCGGTRALSFLFSLFEGLSPRVRGNHRRNNPNEAHQGSIPACAGEPAAHHPKLHEARVYPRVCGGTRRLVHPVGADQGLSPRVRGNH